jgi:nitrile hydratase accessory protein
MTAGSACGATGPLPDLGGVPALPRDAEGAVFAAPWEAKAFALVVHLHQRGLFAWQDWVDALSAEIAADSDRTPETPYYQLWLTAAERLVTSRALVGDDELAATRAALHAAQGAHDHPHEHAGEHHHVREHAHSLAHDHPHSHELLPGSHT